MFNLFQLRKRLQLKTKKLKTDKVKTDKLKTEDQKTNLLSKPVYAFVGNELKGDWDSVTKCATALGMSRPAVKKAIESGETLDNGFKLSLTKK